jgi:hypothetical protein
MTIPRFSLSVSSRVRLPHVTVPDGTVSFITIVPSFTGLEFVMKNGEKPTLVTRDAQHEYVFTPQ